MDFMNTLEGYPCITCYGSNVSFKKWVFRRDNDTKVLEYCKRQFSEQFYETSTERISICILDINQYLKDNKTFLDETKHNYLQSIVTYQYICTIVGKNHGFAFDEYVWLLKPKCKLILNIYKNPHLETIIIRDDGQDQYYNETGLKKFLMTFTFVNETKPKEIIKKVINTINPHYVSPQNDIDNDNSGHKKPSKPCNIYIKNPKGYNYHVQSCKSPPDPYAYLLLE